MKDYKKHTLLVLVTLLMFGGLITAQAQEDVAEELPVIEEETMEISDGMNIYPNLEGSSFLDEDMSANRNLGDNMGGVDEQEITTFAVPSGGPYVGFFTGKTSDSTVLVYPTSSGGTRSTYITNSGNSGVFAVLDQANGRTKIAVAGVIGWVETRHITLYKFDPTSMEHNFYRVRDGKLEHLIASHASTNSAGYSNLAQGDAPSYLKAGSQYLSFDGIYFYNATVSGYNQLIGDYNAGHRNNSINKNSPYYNYFQWVSARSQTKLTTNDFRRYLTNTGYNTPGKSRMFETEKLFADNGSFYGGNAALGFATGIHESGWGTSYFARQRNNYFGHEAYDSSPGMASSYATPNFGIGVHFGRFWNWNYLYAGSSNHHGPNVGNKGIGMNVMYASDPYWGEKISSHYYAMDKLAGQPDYKRYDIGILNTSNVNFRKDASTSSGIVYEQKESGIPLTIIEKKTGSTVNGSNVWYGFSSDAVLDQNKNPIPWAWNTGKEKLPVNLKNSTIYVHSSFVNIVSTGKNSTLLAQDNVQLEKTPGISSTAITIYPLKVTDLKPDPSSTRTTILTVPKNEKLTGYQTDNGWVQIFYGGNVGFVKATEVSRTIGGSPLEGGGTIPDPELPKPGNTSMYVVPSGGLALRSKPNSTASVVVTVAKDKEVKVGAALNGWVHAKYDGKEGYMEVKSLTTTKPVDPKPDPEYPKPGSTTMYVVPDIGVNLREKPDANSTRVTGIPKNGEVKKVGIAINGWVYAEYNGETGYLLLEYLTTTKPTTPPTFPKGDVNGDGKVTSVDYMMIKNYIMGRGTLTEDQKKRADVDGDGKITSRDYMMVKNIIMGR